ncbi:MAG TPA: O-antigen ligase family protein [Acholeplasmataceae bacterium]|nr:O-antigen ligase family protein [Acholeplasmataceae bacterium]
MGINLYSIIDKITSYILIIYIIALVAFENYAPTTWIASYSLYLFMILAIIRILLKGKIKFTYYTIIMLIYGVLLAFSLFWAKDSSYGLKTLYWYTTCVIMTFFVSNYIDSKEKFYTVLNTYIVAGIVLSLLLYSIYGLDIFNIAANSKYGIRLGGEVGNSNAIGLNLAFSVCFALYLLVDFKNNLVKKVFYIVAIFIILPVLFLSGSKKALFVLLFGILYIFITHKTDKKFILRKSKGILFSIALLYLVYWLLNNVSAFWHIGQRVNEMFSTFQGQGVSSTDLSRINMIQISIEQFKNAPLMGNGIAHSKVIFGTYSHNNYVEILMNTGIIGFLTYYSAYLISMYKAYKLSEDEEELVVILGFILITFLIIEMGLVSYYSRYYQILLAAISSVLMKGRKIKNDQ